MTPRARPEPQSAQQTFAPARVDLLVVLAAMVNAIGAKRVGCALRPGLAPEKAREWVRQCLNARRREQFRPLHIEAIFRLAREAGFHDGKHAFDRLVGYHPSNAMSPDEARDDLMRRIHDTQEEVAQRQRRLEGLILQLGELGGGGKGGGE